MKPLLLTLLLVLTSSLALVAQDADHARIDPTRIDIYRDTLGVPHIFAKTDAEVAYGMAWVQCEDQFEYVQEAMLNAKRRLGRWKGKEGAIFDFFVHFTRMDTLVEQRYETAFSPEFKRVLAGFVQGLNDYAEAHPKEVVDKKAYPLTPQDVVLGYSVPMVLNAGLGFAFKAVLDGNVDLFNVNHKEGGSNASAVAPSRTPDGSTYFMSNTHQPNTGRFAWYE
ncbi:MAG: penicillin acylase family protein, partial [Bacteroidota bacterium]